jgi:hypothetical protein
VLGDSRLGKRVWSGSCGSKVGVEGSVGGVGVPSFCSLLFFSSLGASGLLGGRGRILLLTHGMVSLLLVLLLFPRGSMGVVFNDLRVSLRKLCWSNQIDSRVIILPLHSSMVSVGSNNHDCYFNTL